MVLQVPKLSERQKWPSSDWKEELPTRALQHLAQLEQQLDKIRKERDQKQCQLDSLEQVRDRGEGGSAVSCMVRWET